MTALTEITYNDTVYFKENGVWYSERGDNVSPQMVKHLEKELTTGGKATANTPAANSGQPALLNAAEYNKELFVPAFAEQRLPQDAYPQHLAYVAYCFSQQCGVSFEMAAHNVLMAMAGASGGSCIMAYKDEIPSCYSSLYGINLAPSGERKSTTLNAVCKAASEWHVYKLKQASKVIETQNIEHHKWKTKLKGLERAIENHAADGDEAKMRELEIKYQELCDNKPPRIVIPYRTLPKITTQALIYNLAKKYPIQVVNNAEAVTFLNGYGFSATESSSTFGTLNSLWTVYEESGSSTKNDGDLDTQGTILTLNLSIQPEEMQKMVQNQTSFISSGFAARFLYCKAPSLIGTRFTSLKEPTEEELANKKVQRQWIEWFYKRCKNLKDAQFESVDWKGDTGRVEPKYFYPASAQARYELTAYSNEMEAAQAEGGKYADKPSFASKSAEQAARIALNLHVFSLPKAGEPDDIPANKSVVSAETMRHAIKIARYYMEELTTVFDGGVQTEQENDAQELYKQLCAYAKKNQDMKVFTRGKVAINLSAKFRSRAKYNPLFDELAQRGFISVVPGNPKAFTIV